MESLLVLSKRVQEAKHEGKAIVALESTVIAHGLPYPDNLEVTYQMLEAIEGEGAVPALIGLMDGRIKIGLDDAQISLMAKAEKVLKLNKADLGICVAQKRIGATTVAATAHCAHLAGIQVFATGGLGGVHQGVAQTWDISNDLMTLSQTPILVVASGIKSILDVAKTLEVLETLGVPVMGYKTSHLPLFYACSAKYPLQTQCDTPQEVAHCAAMHWALGGQGLVVANPIPQEEALDEALVQDLIQEATQLAHHSGVLGKAVTPFVLQRLTELSRGQTLKANKALLIHNAKTAAQIALSMH